MEWTHQFGTAGNEAVRGIAADGAGNVYVVGDTNGALPGQTSTGGVDVFIRKYNPNGDVIWTRQFGTAGNDFVGFTSGGIAVREGVYVGGFTNGTFPGQTNAGDFDAFLRKYDLNGNELWTRQFGTPGFDDIHDVAVDDDNGVYVAGSVIGQLPGQTWAGGSDDYVRKYDSDGAIVWTRQSGTTAFEHFNAIAVDHFGIYAVGHSDGTQPGQTSAGGFDAYVRRYNRNGQFVWTRQFGTAAFDVPQSVDADDGGIYVVGGTGGTLPGQTSTGSIDVFVRKYNPGGHQMWTRQFGTAGFDEAIGVSSNGLELAVSGVVSGPLPGQTYAGGARDAFVRKYDTLFGNEIWTHQFGTSGTDAALDALIPDTGNTTYVGGRTNGSLPGQTNAGLFDAYLMKLISDD